MCHPTTISNSLTYRSVNPLQHIQAATACDLCDADLANHGITVARGRHELLGISVPLSTMVCRRCRFVFQPERFSDDLLTELYEPDTSFDFGTAVKDRSKNQAGLRERQAVISTALTSHNVREGAAVLDVGGGRGECCQHLVKLHRVTVADTTPCAPVDPGIEKVPGLFSSSMRQGIFDVVVMNHVLEHVFSPTSLLEAAHRVMKADGVLIVEVPFELYTPLVARHLGDWRHVGYFSRTTLRQFLEKSGFALHRLALEEGHYGVRRLSVIRAVARKAVTPSMTQPICNTRMALAADMLAPAALVSMVKSRLRRR